MSTHRLTFHLYPGVIPAKAGIHVAVEAIKMDSRFRGNDEQKSNKATATP
ncbi:MULTISPECIES: hypothetical protein [Rhodanobacter]|uniref:Uncharacterized protein n=1 Tax=Rhodanobacter sp. IGA1.0 TaxID=3158582 RepID=A0AAU7QQH2_9GAMM|nr:hypothetical protein [Rhodanobacter spathiphylli]